MPPPEILPVRSLRGDRAANLGKNYTIAHKAGHGLRRATLTAEMVHVRIAALGRVPRHQSETLVGLVLLEAGNVAEHHHPPVIGVRLLLAANVAGERNIPDHAHTSAAETTPML